MKTRSLLFAIFIVLFISCVKNDDKNSELTTLKGESGISYDESLTKWRELKNSNGNSYIYQTTISSWNGSSRVTELKIEEGKVTSRSYKEFKTNESGGQQEIVDSYTETITNLGTHEKGASALTIDDLYNSCASKYLIADKERNTVYFETEINGLMTLCGFVPNACMDDCFNGVRINAFKWID
jgi:hypothetical protein